MNGDGDLSVVQGSNELTLDQLMQVMQVKGGLGTIKLTEIERLKRVAVLDLSYLHTEGARLCQQSRQYKLGGHLIVSKSKTNLTIQQDNQLLPGDGTDYRIWSLRWRLRNNAPSNFHNVLLRSQGASAAERGQLYVLNEQCLVFNALERMHRGRLTILKGLMMDITKGDMHRD